MQHDYRSKHVSVKCDTVIKGLEADCRLLAEKEQKGREEKEEEEDKVSSKGIAPTTAALILFHTVRQRQTKTPAPCALH